MNKEAIFIDPGLQKQFEQDGFVKIKLLPNETLALLNEKCSGYFPEDSEYFFSSSYLNDFEKKEKISNEIVHLISPSLASYFVNYRSIGAAFLIKGKGAKSEMPMHQDWSIVEESIYFALNVWIPLVPTDETNGTLEVMKGSHNWINAKRAPTLPFPFEGHQEKIKQHLSIINTEPGEVVVLNQALIHYSKPNLSGKIRPAITLGVVSKQADLGLFYWDKENPNQLEKFEQEDDFLLKFENFHQTIFERPRLGKSIGHSLYSIPKIEDTDLEKYLGLFEEPQEKNFFQRIFNR